MCKSCVNELTTDFESIHREQEQLLELVLLRYASHFL